MYKKDLDAKLACNMLPNYFLLSSPELFLNEFYSNLIKDYYKDYDCLKLYYEEYDYNLAYDYLSGMSLFASKKLLFINLAKKPLVKESKELISLINLCKKDKHFAILIIIDDTLTPKYLESLVGANYCRFFRPSSNEATQILAQYAKHLNIKVGNMQTLMLLQDTFEQNLHLCAAELKKFEGFSINENFIRKHCISEALVEFEDFFDMLVKGGDINAMFYKLDLNPIALLNMLNFSFYRLFKLSCSIKLTGRLDFRHALGYIPPPAISQSLSFMANKITLAKYQEIFTSLLECEYELKLNQADFKDEVLLSFILKISRLLKGPK